MRKSRFTDEQMVSIVREADRDTTPTVAKRHGVSEQTIYTWRKRFGRVRGRRRAAAEAARSGERPAEEAGGRAGPRDRSDEGGRRKKMVSVPERRAAVAHAVSRGLSHRRACHADRGCTVGAELSFAPGGEGCAGAEAHGGALGPISALRIPSDCSLPRPRWPRHGFERAYRLWRKTGLQVPRKRPRKRIAAGRPRPMAPTGANQVWSYDFVFDWCANGQKLKCLTVTDEWTREGLAIEVDGRIRSSRVIEVLSRLVSERGAPLYLRSDNGPEFVSRALLAWIIDQGTETALIDPGKPWQNGTGESFNGMFRDECLSLEWFRSRAEAKVMIEAWRRHYKRGAAPLEPRLPDAGRLRGEDQDRTPSGHDGAGRCGMWGLRGSPRRSTAPQGANRCSNRGSSLKLSVVRRIQAGQLGRGAGEVSGDHDELAAQLGPRHPLLRLPGSRAPDRLHDERP